MRESDNGADSPFVCLEDVGTSSTFTLTSMPRLKSRVGIWNSGSFSSCVEVHKQALSFLRAFRGATLTPGRAREERARTLVWNFSNFGGAGPAPQAKLQLNCRHALSASLSRTAAFDGPQVLRGSVIRILEQSAFLATR